MPTHFMTLDMIPDKSLLRVFKGESSTGAKHNAKLVRMAQEVAASQNWAIPVSQLAVPYGTDAAPFSLSGISAVYLGVPPHLYPNYHTRHDTYEHVRPESLSAILQLVIEMIQRIDKS